MTLKSTIAASLFAIMAALSLSVSAASTTSADAKIEESTQQKAMKPHSHVQDKTGIPQKAPEITSEKPNAASDHTKPARVKVVVASVMQPTFEYRDQPNASL